MKIYFLIAKLLDYPTEELTQHLAEISSLVQQSTEIKRYFIILKNALPLRKDEVY